MLRKTWVPHILQLLTWTVKPASPGGLFDEPRHHGSIWSCFHCLAGCAAGMLWISPVWAPLLSASVPSRPPLGFVFCQWHVSEGDFFFYNLYHLLLVQHRFWYYSRSEISLFQKTPYRVILFIKLKTKHKQTLFRHANICGQKGLRTSDLEWWGAHKQDSVPSPRSWGSVGCNEWFSGGEDSKAKMWRINKSGLSCAEIPEMTLWNSLKRCATGCKQHPDKETEH